MLFTLLLTLLASASGTPVRNSSHPMNINIDASPSLSPHTREIPECLKLGSQYRTTAQIVWACLATMFACTWVAVHPNLPGLHESGFQQLRRRIFVAIGVIITPEFMAVWATRQRHAAKIIKKEFNDQFNDGTDPELSVWRKAKQWFTGPPKDEIKSGWTLAHGFFVQMGGFMMYHEGKPVQVLTFDRLLKAIARGEIDVPHIPEEDIMDKSKGDGLSKLIVVLQTMWFVAQCMGRLKARLPLAELEVVTLAFAVLNAFFYYMWWSKPQSIIYPIKLEFKTQSTSANKTLESSRRSSASITSTHNTTDPEVVSSSHDARSHNSSESPPLSHRKSSGDSIPESTEANEDGEIRRGTQPVVEELFDKESFHWIYRKLSKVLLSLQSSDMTPLQRISSLLKALAYICFLQIQYPLRTAAKTEMNLESKKPSEGGSSSTKFAVGRTRVPMFYAEERDFVNSPAFWSSTIIVPLIFGGIHLTLWSSTFQNSAEKWLWRASAIYITAEPLLFFAAFFAMRLLKPESPSAAYAAVGLTLLVYTFARLILIFMSFFTLISLPEEMYVAVDWADVFPHI